MSEVNSFLPKTAKVISKKELAKEVKLFRLKFDNEKVAKSFKFSPGQFIQVSVFGFGEAPFGITSSPENKEYIEILVKKIGTLTSAIHNLKIGDTVGIRGPFGRGLPIEYLRNKNVLVAAGGFGISPLRSLFKYTLDTKGFLGKIMILYGARTPADLLFKDEFGLWRKNFDLHLTVDNPDKNWKGNIGVITILFNKLKVPKNTIALLCGPPIMYKFVIKELLKRGVEKKNIFVLLERRMKCGMGICQHCDLGEHYVCTDGPVFRYSEVDKEEAI